MNKIVKNILKVVVVIVVVVIIVAFVGFKYLYNNGLSGQTANTKVKDGQIKVACIGDSITYGHGISGWEKNNYPAVLGQILGEEYHVANFGSSGTCVNPNGDQPYTGRAIYQESLDYNADILVFMLGTNDSKPENWTDAATFFAQHKALLDTYMQGENLPKVYIGTCAQAYYVDGVTEGVAEYDIQPQIVDEIAALLQEMYAQGDVEIVDVHGLTEEHPE
ncbi:MAG: hypothetical protein IJ274_01515, partial [Lachnospiraceae bacterium]|nr:hypothetical protein [Lachnospiraceae bacterium]